QAEDGIRDPLVTGVQTCALPISAISGGSAPPADQVEATLDVMRATSVAPGATIKLVVSASAPSLTGGGLGFASQYVVDNRVAQIMNISFGSCEAIAGRSGIDSWDSLFSQAAAEGI